MHLTFAVGGLMFAHPVIQQTGERRPVPRPERRGVAACCPSGTGVAVTVAEHRQGAVQGVAPPDRPRPQFSFLVLRRVRISVPSSSATPQFFPVVFFSARSGVGRGRPADRRLP
jgi:hypothetical protein